ncbi:hypothetical protein L6J37_06160 [Photobacterium sp. WH77]|uniref:hypothetical protein n=1 Tax=unclassified Photobacterium TaxID=2628852 RepID=UPI001EDC41B5|nr:MULTISPECIES: hypothetical protein [unclassified Photobacterium]MCG2836448.1 hypothetical protein [Photobacterium sp. WH77]MCG2843925.1 hypothetical protein [Photobacterium sp. WH80]
MEGDENMNEMKVINTSGLITMCYIASGFVSSMLFNEGFNELLIFFVVILVFLMIDFFF